MIILDDNDDAGMTHSATEHCSDSPRQWIWRFDMATNAMNESRACSIISNSPCESIFFYNMARGVLTPSRYSSKSIRFYYANYVKVFSSSSPQTLSGEKKQRTEDGQQIADAQVASVQSGMLLVCCLPYPAMAASFLTTFGMCWGFKQLWMKKGIDEIALVEFEDENSATMAMNILQGYEVRPLKTLIIYRVK